MDRPRNDRICRVCTIPVKMFVLGLVVSWYIVIVPEVTAQTYDFDEGVEVLTQGLISRNKEALKDKKIAVFGIIESKSKKKWEISSHIEDGIVDVLVNSGYTVIERRRVDDVIKKEIKKTADLWFDETQAAQFGKLVGADIVVTGRYVKWGRGMLRISIRAISVSKGKIIAVNKVKILTDRIADLLRPEEGVKPPVSVPEKPSPGSKTKAEGRQPRGYPGGYPPKGQSEQVAPPAPQMGYYCCDQLGNRRCQLVQPMPIGSSCFCFGQGYGYVCQ